ncbi:hypothetical protein EYF80_044279 [Liparis tanakae]|uniref:Uncharacterized protein n=1 Tax=Liparis tanakae TaxID=230148 RepID=A0A4Z2FWA8_9TELE|nr:hypothetical protein EYF80_044279 [Liparis tanakae]
MLRISVCGSDSIQRRTRVGFARSEERGQFPLGGNVLALSVLALLAASRHHQTRRRKCDAASSRLRCQQSVGVEYDSAKTLMYRTCCCDVEVESTQPGGVESIKRTLLVEEEVLLRAVDRDQAGPQTSTVSLGERTKTERGGMEQETKSFSLYLLQSWCTCRQGPERTQPEKETGFKRGGAFHRFIALRDQWLETMAEKKTQGGRRENPGRRVPYPCSPVQPVLHDADELLVGELVVVIHVKDLEDGVHKVPRQLQPSGHIHRSCKLIW